MALTEKDILDYLAAWNAHDAEGVTAFFTEDPTYEDVAMGMVNQG